MKELVLYVAQSLVDNKEAVTVLETAGPEATILELHVAPEDMGKVIGKQGRIAKAIRAVVRAATAKDPKAGFCGDPVTDAVTKRSRVAQLPYPNGVGVCAALPVWGGCSAARWASSLRAALVYVIQHQNMHALVCRESLT